MTRYVLLMVYTAAPRAIEDCADAVETYRRELRRAGRLIQAGALGPGSGALEVFVARDRLDAEATVRSHPWVREGLCAWWLWPWQPEGAPE